MQGFLWLATRNDEAGVWTQAGGSFATEYGGTWDGEENEEGDDLGDSEVDDDGSHDDDAGGHTRCTELVFIGLGMDDDALKAELERCLLTEEEMAGGPEAWRERLEDPFPPWQ